MYDLDQSYLCFCNCDPYQVQTYVTPFLGIIECAVYNYHFSECQTLIVLCFGL